MTTLLLVISLFQVETTIPKNEKNLYWSLVQECEKASLLIDTSPSDARKVFAGIIENKEILSRECLLRIQSSSGTYSKKYDFFPYQFRGRCYLKLAGKAVVFEEKERYLKQAFSDFEESVRLGLPSSKIFRDETGRQLSSLEKPKEKSPTSFSESDFRRSLQSLMREDRFRTAQKYLREQGGFLSDNRKASYEKEIESECLHSISTTTQRFLRNLEIVEMLDDLEKMPLFLFRKKFDLPASDEFVVQVPVYSWCEILLETLKKAQKGGDVREALKRHALESIALSDSNDNAWFKAVDHLILGVVKASVRIRVLSAKDSPKKKRDSLRKEAEALIVKWKAFGRKVTQVRPGIERISGDPQTLLSGFPREWAGLKEIEEKVLEAGNAEFPDKALLEIEILLEDLWEKAPLYSLESRRSILQMKIAVKAVHRLFEGKSVSQVEEYLRSEGRKLRQVGGDFKVDRFGPRVRKVFDRLSQS